MADRSPAARRLRRLLIYPLEAILVVLGYGFFRLLPLDTASALGGWLGRIIGRCLPVSRRAAANIRRAMPELDQPAIAKIIRDMWDNLGRVTAEYPHLEQITRNTGSGGRVEVAGVEHAAAIRDAGTACILFSGHFSNWEVFPLSLRDFGFPCAQVYRAANNPLVDRMLLGIRRVTPPDTIPKGRRGARQAMAVLRQGRRLGMLVDQKMNDGIPVAFFGRDAMTPPALAQFALRFECKVLPVHLERTEGCHFRLTFHPSLEITDSGDRQADASAIMTEVNAIMEGWIRERPAQWLWVHRRWPDD